MTNQLQTTYRSLTDLVARRHLGNPKDHDVPGIIASVVRFGFNDPITLDARSDIIVEGHGRIKALVEMFKDGQQPPARVDRDGDGAWMVPTLSIPFTDDDERDSYVIAHNKLVEAGGWNEEALATLLAKLGSGNLASMGYTKRSYDQLLARFRKPSTLADDDVPELPTIPTTQPGDRWIFDEGSVLLCADCSSISSSALLSGCVREFTGLRGFGFTSPPYNAGKDNAGNDDRMRNGEGTTKARPKSGKSSPSRYGPQGPQSAAELPGSSDRGERRPGYTRYDVHDDKLTDEQYTELLRASTMLMLASCEIAVVNLQLLAGNKRAIGRWAFDLCEQLVDRAVWSKGGSRPALSPKVLDSRFEDLYIFAPTKNPSRTITTASFHGTVSNVYEGASQTSREFSDVHAATMPVHLAQWAIEQLGHQADFVVDPFAGTGTSLVVAEQLGKRFAGVERSGAYCDVIVARWQNLTGRLAVRIPAPV